MWCWWPGRIGRKAGENLNPFPSDQFSSVTPPPWHFPPQPVQILNWMSRWYLSHCHASYLAQGDPGRLGKEVKIWYRRPLLVLASPWPNPPLLLPSPSQKCPLPISLPPSPCFCTAWLLTSLCWWPHTTSPLQKRRASAKFCWYLTMPCNLHLLCQSQFQWQKICAATRTGSDGGEGHVTWHSWAPVRT